MRHKCHPSVLSKKSRHITVSQEAMSNNVLMSLKKPKPGKVFKVYAITGRGAVPDAIFLSSVA
jgi:hypothetical protein